MKGLKANALVYSYVSNDNPRSDRPYVTIKGLEVQGFRMSSEDKMFSIGYDTVAMDMEVMSKFEDNPTPENFDLLNQSIHRTMHFALLNSGMAVAGMRWPVTEDIYWYFLEILPPLDYFEKSEGFRICEANGTDPLGNYIRSAYYFEKGTYWHEYVADEK